MFQFLYYKHNTITKITIYMHSSQYYGSHRNVGTIKRFVHICHMAPKVYNSNFKHVIAIAGAVVNVNAIRIISNTLPQFGEIIHTFHQ